MFRCYGWQSNPNLPVKECIASQDENCRMEFKDRADRAILQLNEQGLNAKLYWDNDDLAHTVSLVPTSAITGEGIPDLLKMVITLTQERLTEQLMFMVSFRYIYFLIVAVSPGSFDVYLLINYLCMIDSLFATTRRMCYNAPCSKSKPLKVSVTR
jgi:hypothetical protein